MDENRLDKKALDENRLEQNWAHGLQSGTCEILEIVKGSVQTNETDGHDCITCHGKNVIGTLNHFIMVKSNHDNSITEKQNCSLWINIHANFSPMRKILWKNANIHRILTWLLHSVTVVDTWVMVTVGVSPSGAIENLTSGADFLVRKIYTNYYDKRRSRTETTQ